MCSLLISSLTKYDKWLMFTYKMYKITQKVLRVVGAYDILSVHTFPTLMVIRQQCIACTRHGVPTLCASEVARSLTLSNPFWIAVKTARSSCAIISEILVFRESRVWISCCACVVRMSRGFSVSWSISHCRKVLLKVYVTPI